MLITSISQISIFKIFCCGCFVQLLIACQAKETVNVTNIALTVIPAPVPTITPSAIGENIVTQTMASEVSSGIKATDIATSFVQTVTPTPPFFFNATFEKVADLANWEILQEVEKVTVANGVLQVSNTYAPRFPYVRTKQNPFPLSGDFTLTIRVRFPSLQECGVGILATNYKLPAGLDEGADSEYRKTQDMAGLSLGIWQDGYMKGLEVQFALQGPKQIKSVSVNSLTGWRVIKIQYINSIYTISVDNARVYISKPSSLRPSSLLIGHWVGQTNLENCHWTSMDIDYITVTNF